MRWPPWRRWRGATAAAGNADIPEWVKKVSTHFPEDLEELAALPQKYTQVTGWDRLITNLTKLRASQDPQAALEQVGRINNPSLKGKMAVAIGSQARSLPPEEIRPLVESATDLVTRESLLLEVLRSRDRLRSNIRMREDGLTTTTSIARDSIPFETAMELIPLVSVEGMRHNFMTDHLGAWLKGERTDEEIAWAENNFPEHLLHDARVRP